LRERRCKSSLCWVCWLFSLGMLAAPEGPAETESRASNRPLVLSNCIFVYTPELLLFMVRYVCLSEAVLKAPCLTRDLRFY